MLCTSGSDVGGDAATDVDGSDVGGGVGVSRRVRSSQPSEPTTASAPATTAIIALLAFDVDGTLAASIAVKAERRRRRLRIRLGKSFVLLAATTRAEIHAEFYN